MCVSFGYFAPISFLFLIFVFNPFTHSNWLQLQQTQVLTCSSQSHRPQSALSCEGEENGDREEVTDRPRWIKDMASGGDWVVGMLARGVCGAG